MNRESKFEDKDYWKAIILYGLNVATYKIALGKTLLELTNEGRSEFDWIELSKKYLDNYVGRLAENPKPQQSNPSRLTVMERIVQSLKSQQIDYNQAVERVSVEAFNDVIPRFQTIGSNKSIVNSRFYHFDHGSKLYLRDAVFKVSEDNQAELLNELEARWSLLEGAFSLSQGDYSLSNDIRNVYLENSYKRTNITGNIPFLQGYQGNICFYCGESMNKSKIHVDHVLPRQVLGHDQIWNLVLSHDICNLHKNDSLIGIHYLEKLMARNENIMGSNHPWKKKIAEALGTTPLMRKKTTKTHYENAKIVLKSNFWENSPKYNRETDPFFKKLITVLNNR